MLFTDANQVVYGEIMDRYSKGLLTIIAICLFIITLKQLTPIEPAFAAKQQFQMSGQGAAVFIMRADGAVRQCYASAHHDQNNKCGKWVQ